MKTVNLEQTKALIPLELMKRIEAIEFYNRNQTSGPMEKIAAFDLDNTLLEGDIGEAVFSQLKIDEKKQPVTVTKTMMPFTWAQCRELLKKNKKKEAYTKMITAMAGIPVETVIQATHRIMNSNDPFLEVEGVRVLVPKPRPVMQALVQYLKSLDYTVYIISATNSYSVRYMAEEYFGVSSTHAIGMQARVTHEEELGEILSDTIDGPITVGEGKVEAYHHFIGPMPPLVTAGDSDSDIQILRLTLPWGLCIWAGENEKKYEAIKNKLHHPHTAYFLKKYDNSEVAFS